MHAMRLVTVHAVGWFSDPLANELEEDAREAGVDVTIPASRIYWADIECGGDRERWPIAREDAERIVSAAMPEEKPYTTGSSTSPVFAGPVSVELPEPDQPLAPEPEPQAEVFSFAAGPHRAEPV